MPCQVMHAFVFFLPKKSEGSHGTLTLPPDKTHGIRGSHGCMPNMKFPRQNWGNFSTSMIYGRKGMPLEVVPPSQWSSWYGKYPIINKLLETSKRWFISPRRFPKSIQTPYLTWFFLNRCRLESSAHPKPSPSPHLPSSPILSSDSKGFCWSFSCWCSQLFCQQLYGTLSRKRKPPQVSWLVG